MVPCNRVSGVAKWHARPGLEPHKADGATRLRTAPAEFEVVAVSPLNISPSSTIHTHTHNKNLRTGEDEEHLSGDSTDHHIHVVKHDRAPG